MCCVLCVMLNQRLHTTQHTKQRGDRCSASNVQGGKGRQETDHRLMFTPVGPPVQDSHILATSLRVGLIESLLLIK